MVQYWVGLGHGQGIVTMSKDQRQLVRPLDEQLVVATGFPARECGGSSGVFEVVCIDVRVQCFVWI